MPRRSLKRSTFAQPTYSQLLETLADHQFLQGMACAATLEGQKKICFLNPNNPIPYETF